MSLGYKLIIVILNISNTIGSKAFKIETKFCVFSLFFVSKFVIFLIFLDPSLFVSRFTAWIMEIFHCAHQFVPCWLNIRNFLIYFKQASSLIFRFHFHNLRIFLFFLDIFYCFAWDLTFFFCKFWFLLKIHTDSNQVLDLSF